MMGRLAVLAAATLVLSSPPAVSAEATRDEVGAIFRHLCQTGFQLLVLVNGVSVEAIAPQPARAAITGTNIAAVMGVCPRGDANQFVDGFTALTLYYDEERGWFAIFPLFGSPDIPVLATAQGVFSYNWALEIERLDVP